MVDVAQLVRAPGCGPGGRGFESHHSPFVLKIQFSGLSVNGECNSMVELRLWHLML